jgi:hypothetical protein
MVSAKKTSKKRQNKRKLVLSDVEALARERSDGA